jgi:RNA polymerase I-specific transcription initiation factor RRN3
LKSFFPFDPLLLRRSHVFVEPFYRNWQGPVEEEDVLVIDDAPDDEDDQIFDMDEDEDGSDSDDEEDEVPVVVSDQETKEEPDSDSDGAELDDCFTASPTQTKNQQKKIWTETMKRPRSQSMENGSW